MKTNGFKDVDYAREPRAVLKRFLEEWEKRDWAGMAKDTQKSWVLAMPDPEEMLKAVFSYKPIEATLVREAMLSNVAYACILNVRYLVARGVSADVQFDVRVICEIDKLMPSPDGDWGVNPVSLTPTMGLGYKNDKAENRC